jgi:hypothetical protein
MGKKDIPKATTITVAWAFIEATIMTIANMIINRTTAVLAMLKVNEVSGAHKDIIQRMAATAPDTIPINCPSLKKMFIVVLFSVIF